jgi:hypothetical protein
VRRVRRHESKIQLIAPPGPAMKPSSDIDLFTTSSRSAVTQRH